MDFTLGEDRQMLVDMLGRYLSDNYDIGRRAAIIASGDGWSRETWLELAELGIIGALFDEASGGFGGTGFDIGAVFGELGRALVVEPFLGTLLAGHVLAAAGLGEIVGQAIAGSTILAFAHDEPHGDFDPVAIETTARCDDDNWLMTGSKAVVRHAARADLMVVTARSSGKPGDRHGISAFIVARDAPGLSSRAYGLIDGGSASELAFHDTPATLIGAEGAAFNMIEAAIAAGLVALAWEAVAVMDALETQTLGYLRTRKQFGVPIGSFQALQHRMATLALEIEQAQSAAINAAASLGGDRVTRERAVSAAKYTVGQIGSLATEEAIQLHGGIGMTWELPLSHYAKRLIMIGHQLGDEDYHLNRYVAMGRDQS